jgi:23S rRNA pseudouridine1911/1915/1917 synthase
MTGSIIRHEAVVPLSAAGRRFDQALAEMFPDYSRSRLTAWIKAGAVTLDGAPAVPRHLLQGGEQVRLEAELETEVSSAPEAIALDVVHEDEHLLVLNKPAGLVVHPGAGNPAGTLLNALLHHDPKLAQLPRAGIVHRLDVGTSGLMVVAKSERAYTELKRQFHDREVDKIYHAVVQGHPDPFSGTIDAPIGRHPGSSWRFAVTADGKPSVTHYATIEAMRSATLLEIHLETGRTHQIRVHMAAQRHPCVGDLLYGADPVLAARLGLQRQWLHALRLGFRHPGTGERVDFETEYPPDLQHALDVLRAD